MALFNCPECGKQISDKAYACPNCGAPVHHTSQTLLRCPNCGGTAIQFHREQTATVGGRTNRVVVDNRRRHGCLYWVCIGWWYWPLFGWWIRLLRGGRKRFGLNVNAEKTINRTVGICQTCGYSWHIDPAAPPAQEAPAQEPQFEDNNVPETEDEEEPDDGTPSPIEEAEPDDETTSSQNNFGTDPEDKKRAIRVAVVVVIIIILLIILAAIITRRHNHNLQEEEPQTEETINNAQVVEEEEEEEETRKEQRKERREERREERRKEREAKETTNDDSQEEQEVEQETFVEEGNPLDAFRYEINEGSITLESYSGDDSTVEILPSYTVEGVEYATDLSDFSARGIKNLILGEGITEFNLSMFYECENSIEKIYFPKSLSVVYDYTLADLCDDNENIYEIYYAGSEEEWDSIFTEYDPDWRNEEDPYNKGAELGQRINIIVGQVYDASKFAYFYNQSVDDFLLTITD